MNDVLETPRQLAARVGLSKYQIRKLVVTGELEHVLIVKRVHIPLSAWERFIEANTRGGKSWQGETRDPSSDGLQSAKPTTSPGQSTVAAASARLAQQAARQLRSFSQNGCKSGPAEMAQVIPLKF